MHLTGAGQVSHAIARRADASGLLQCSNSSDYGPLAANGLCRLGIRDSDLQ